MDSSDGDESFSLTVHDPQKHVKRKGYFVSKGKLTVSFIAVICLLVVVGVLSAIFSWNAGIAARQGIY